MVEVLEEFIAADSVAPCRTGAVIAWRSYKDLLPRADVSLTEKYRRILGAYQVEAITVAPLEARRGELLRRRLRSVGSFPPPWAGCCISKPSMAMKVVASRWNP